MPTSTQVHAQPDTSIERLKAAWTHRLLTVAVPWSVALVLLAGGLTARHYWGGRGAATAAAVAGLALATVIVSVAAGFATRHRAAMLWVHSAVTGLAAGAWFCAIVAVGPDPAAVYLYVLLTVTLALTWNLRRPHAPAADSTGVARISDLFETAADPAGLKGAKLRVREVGPRKARALVSLVPGQHTAADLVRAVGRVESGMQLPPGSLTASENADRADLAELTISDPRVMREPIPWPGPSRPGASIAEPIRLGLWQDADTAEITVPGYHVQEMGMTGSGKGFGGAWNWLGEVITRDDVAVFAADLTKGDQTLGPLRPALHGLETDLAGVRGLMTDMHLIVRPRTDFLASRGKQRWERDCGLTYIVLWLEETPDILDKLSSRQMEAFESMVKAMRSAGMTIVFSLQRSTYDQIPTLIRGQAANWCFGVANGADGKYGLSERQDEGGAAPERWQNAQPGMAYLDAPGVPEDRIAMPMRCFFWGDDASVMAPHAARFPASARPLDALTARLLADAAAARASRAPRAALRPVADPAGIEDEDEDQAAGASSAAWRRAGAEFGSGADDETEDQDEADEMDDDEETPEQVRASYLTEPDPDAELAAGLDDAIEAPGADDPFGALEFPEPERMDPAEARTRFRALLAEWADEGRQDFGTSDLYDFLSTTGLGRGWLHKQINAAADDGLIDPVVDAERGRFGRYELCPPESDVA